MSPGPKRPSTPRQARKYPKPFKVLFEDQYIIVAEKSAGILTVPIPGASSKNLKDLLDDYLVPQKKRAITVHRIDRFTSGLVVFAKAEPARDNLVAQFKARTPERVYLAVVRGKIEDEGTLRHNLMLGKAGFRQYSVPSGGTSAVTHFKVIERIGDISVLEVRLESGLKNQIRVQFMEAGHPLVGDRHYTAAEAEEKLLDRQALHAWKLGFVHPVNGRHVFFESEPAFDIQKMLAKLRNTEKYRLIAEKKKARLPKEEEASEPEENPNAEAQPHARAKPLKKRTKRKGKRRVPHSKTPKA